MSLLHLPLDHESWHEFRQLRQSVGHALASHMFIRLFVELGYQAQAGIRLGLLEEKAIELFLDSIAEASGARPEGPHGGRPQGLQALLSAGLLLPTEGGYLCPRFAQLNPHLDPSHEPMHVKGWKTSKLNRDLRKYGGMALQQSLMIPDEVWTRPSGQKMEYEEIRQIMLLVRACDGALGRPERPHNSNGFTQMLVQNAWRIVTEFSPEQIDSIVRGIMACRSHPAIPPTTEQLLPKFKEIAGRFASHEQ
jgi:hypothetical protein